MTLPKKRDVAVYIGRFQPFHLGHLALLRQALEVAEHVIVVLGSAFQARTPKNPFTWLERCEIIQLSLSADEQSRLHFIPVRDYYDEDQWVQAVQQGVTGIVSCLLPGQASQIVMIGHFKDTSSRYLQGFQAWELLSVPRANSVDATSIRDAFLGCAGQNLGQVLASLASATPPGTLSFLRAWAALPPYLALCQEWEILRRYKAAWAQAPYPPVFVTADALVRCNDAVLLIQRGQAPGLGLYALPGGFIDPHERTYDSALRELREETRLGTPEAALKACFKGSAVFDHPERSQRGRTITHAFYFDLGQRAFPDISAADDAQAVAWIPLSHISSLEDQFHDDHFHILNHFITLPPKSEPH
jgi:bifunctional NMN adenylyltransferase/nudix hydrolase